MYYSQSRLQGESKFSLFSQWRGSDAALGVYKGQKREDVAAQ